MRSLLSFGEGKKISGKEIVPEISAKYSEEEKALKIDETMKILQEISLDDGLDIH